MTDKEKLVDLLVEFPTFPASMDYIRQFEMIVLFAEWLADKGVTFATDKNDGGKWIINGEWGECSHCHEASKLSVMEHKDYCPACGASMDEESVVIPL